MDNKNVKDIKIGNNNILKIMSNNNVLWQKLLKPDYEFYDSEIGNNSNWAQNDLGYWYLSKFEGQYIVYVRYPSGNNSHLCVGADEYNWYDIYESILGIHGTTDESQYIPMFFDPELGIYNSERLAFKNKGNDNTYKTYVFICPKEYNAMFDSQLQYFIQSLNNSN